MDETVQRLVADVLKSGKYAHITPQLVSRIGAEELAKGRKYKKAVKATKNKLHQVGGAYQKTSPQYAAWYKNLAAVAGNEEDFKAACRQTMAYHASTHERLSILEEFYPAVFDHLPAVKTILDVACGLNPLAIPWMPLAAGVEYTACDMYADMVEFVGDVLDLMPMQGQAEVCDVVHQPPTQPVDLALILKTIPCLEQVDKDAGTRLIDSLNAEWLVISYPAKSLGGRSKGMVENYEAHFEALQAGRGWQAIRLLFETELVFVVHTQGD